LPRGGIGTLREKGAMQPMRSLKSGLGIAVLLMIGPAGALTLSCTIQLGRGGSQVQPPQATAAGQPASQAVAVRTDHYGDALPADALARLGTVRFRHLNNVRRVAFSKDGTRIGSASWDQTLRVWDATTGRELHRFSLPAPESAAISPNGKIVAGGGRDKSLRLWVMGTGEELYRATNLENAVTAVCFSSNGNAVAALSNPVIRVWDIDEKKELRQFQDPANGMYTLALSHDGKLLAGGGKDQVWVWEVGSGKLLHRLKGQAGSKESVAFIYAVAFAPKSKIVASGGTDSDPTVRLWDVATGKEVRRISRGPGWVRPIAFSSDGKMLACGGVDSKVQLYDVATGEELRRLQLPGRDDTWVMSLDFSPDGKRLVTSGSEKVIRLWDVATGKKVQLHEGHQAAVSQVAVTPDGRAILTAGQDCMICRWDRATGRRLWQARQTGSVSQMALAADGQRAVTTDGGVLRIWDVATGKETRTLPISKGGWVRAVALSPDGSVLAAAAWDRTIRLLSIPSCKERLRIPLRTANQDYRGDCPLAFLPDGKTLISGSADNTNQILYLWDTATGKELRRIAHPVSRMALSPDGRLLATTGRDPKVRLWDLASSKSFLEIGTEAATLAWSPDGRTLVTGDRSGIVHLWEAASGRERRRFAAHDAQEGSFNAGVASLAFAPDGKTLFSGGYDTTVLIWDLRGTTSKREPIETHWAALAKLDAGQAYDSICALLATPPGTVQYLKSHLTPVALPDAHKVTPLISDLDSEQFTVRSQAERELERLGEGVLSALRKALDNQPSAELRRRATQLIEKLTSPTPTSDRLRAVRAIEVLEAIGTEEARSVLAALAKGLPEARQTQEAKAALDRLGRK
jgi:WD40 repeat protein